MSKIISISRTGDVSVRRKSALDDGEVGRPTDNPKTERCDVRLTPAEKKKFLALGGSEWLRKMLRKV